MPAKTGNKETPQGAYAMRDSPEVLPDPFKRSTRIQRSPEQLGGKTTQERSQSSPPTLQDKSLMIKKSENLFVDELPTISDISTLISYAASTLRSLELDCLGSETRLLAGSRANLRLVGLRLADSRDYGWTIAQAVKRFLTFYLLILHETLAITRPIQKYKCVAALSIADTKGAIYIFSSLQVSPVATSNCSCCCFYNFRSFVMSLARSITSGSAGLAIATDRLLSCVIIALYNPRMVMVNY
uniref:Uncharacterized protein n=1 Tax=Glossina pallidipes TaxID=7398 RepID=A0A1A9ZQJ6_GLOPL